MLMSENALPVLLLTIRAVVASRQALTLLNEQSLAIQKLSAEVFEMQNGHSEVGRGLASTAQALARIEREIQSVGAAVAGVRSMSGAGGAESMAQFGKEIKRVLQTKEISDLMDATRASG